MIIGILLIVIVILLLIILLLSYSLHEKSFGPRFDKDPLVSYYMPEDFQIEREDIVINNGKKKKLRGYVYNRAHKTKEEVVIFAHGLWSNVDAYNQEICYFAGLGYEVVAINFEGVSSSDGKNLVGCGSSVKGLDLLITHLESLDQYKNRPIYLVGHSWGGHGVLNVCKFHPEVKKVIAMSPVVSLTRFLKPNFPKGMGLALPFANFIDKCKLGKYGALDAIKSLKNYQGEVLIVACDSDPVVKYDLNALPLINKYPNFQTLMVPNRGHNPDYTEEAVNKMFKYLEVLNTLEGSSLDNFKKNTNFKKLGELDLKVMEELKNFLEK